MKILNDNCLTNLLRRFNTESKVWTLLNCSFIFHCILLFFFLILFQTVDTAALGEVDGSSSNNPFLFTRFTHTKTSFWIMFIIVSLMISVEIVFSICANIFTLLAIRQTKELVHRKTLRMQLSVYRIISLQNLMVFVFFYFPIVLSAILKVAWDRFAVYTAPFGVCFSALYVPASFLIQRTHFKSTRKGVLQSNSAVNVHM